MGTFRRYFGETPCYVVYTDRPDVLRQYVPAEVELPSIGNPGDPFFDNRANWKKWAFRFRHDPSATEFRIDTDIFLVNEPTELLDFAAGNEFDYLVTTEDFEGAWPYGCFRERLPTGFLKINAGLVGQRAGHDLTAEMLAAYRWWCARAETHGTEYHDEQGAMANVLYPHWQQGRVQALDAHKYVVLCPRNDPPILSLDGIAAIHTTYPERPGYWKFRADIAASSGQPESLRWYSTQSTA
jgi:hypothetical protein